MYIMHIFYEYVISMQNMKEKIKRLTALRKIIEASPSANQAELLRSLRLNGINATQPSISRDLKELGIAKIAGSYRPIETKNLPSSQIIFNQILTMQSAGQNLFVIKTEEGAANVVANQIDHMEFDGILGTVAGDDTILLATRNRAVQKRLVTYLECQQNQGV
jgi:transcriptional regulator of arginine metabolism